MQNNFELSKFIISLKPRYRLIMIILIDLLILLVSFLFINSKNTGNLDQNEIFFSFILMGFITFFIYFLTGQYKNLIRYVGSKTFYDLSLRNSVISIFLFLLPILIYKKIVFNIRDIFIFWILLTTFNSASRIFLRDLLIKILGLKKLRKKIVIYGAGSAGAQLFASLRLAYSYEVKLFVDDNPDLWNRTLNGTKINPFSYLKDNAKKFDLVLLAIPSLSNKNRSKIINKLQQTKLPVLQIPSLDELTNGGEINSLKPIAVEDLLGRPNTSEEFSKDLQPIYKGSTCLVTGAGGSIGSELCKSIISFNPAKIILFERNEPSLFLLEQQLLTLLDPSVELISVLGCTRDEKLLSNIFESHKVDYVFHAAAYKHVPLVELNPLQGILNNVFSTDTVCKAAYKSNVRKLILISSDKAVRPTNIMGASKRLSELVVQSYAEMSQNDNNLDTVFAIVRFGNVLGSSGSVVPTFLKQIAERGPVTITHPKIIRYFMTIDEAAKLVLQASIFANGGEVFLLDMGKPRKIYDLAKTMILLSGLTIKDEKNPHGDIEIKFTGLRPGEKLYEELLIGTESISTNHQLIFKANEISIPVKILQSKLTELYSKLLDQNKREALSLLSELVPEWKKMEYSE